MKHTITNFGEIVLKHMTCCTFQINNTLWVLSSYVELIKLRW